MESRDDQLSCDVDVTTTDRCLSRRRFVVGGLLAVTGGSQLVNDDTLAQFGANVAASGTVQIDGDPALNYEIIENNPNGNTSHVQYDINYQVEWVQGFQSVNIYVDNNPNDKYDPSADAEQSFLDQPAGGSLSTDTFWSYGGDTFEFIFDVSSSTDDGFRKIVEDESGNGSNESDGDFGNVDSPEFEWILIVDRSHTWHGAIFDVYYEISKPSNFENVSFEFRDTTNSSASVTKTNSNSPNGTVQYEPGSAFNDTFEIIGKVIDDDGYKVDSVTVSTDADGNDPAGYGDPVRSDSPQLDSFTVNDSTSGNVEFTIDYSVSNTTRWGGVDVVLNNQTRDAPNYVRSDHSPPYESVTYTGNNWNEGDPFYITVDVLETRNGVTFPISSGTVEDISGGSDSPTTYPQDSI